MQTLDDINIPSTQYVSINTLTGIPVGTKIRIQNKSSYTINLVESNMQPLTDYRSGYHIPSFTRDAGEFVIDSGSLEVWAICVDNEGTASCGIQV